MAANSTHQQYDDYLEIWQTVRDCMAGQKAIKGKGTTYLPIPNPDESNADSARYMAYKQRALFLNVAGRTVKSLTGAAFRKEPEFIVPDSMSYILDNADNSGNSIVQLAKSGVSEAGSIGRVGLLVDYPGAEEGLSKEEVKARGLRSVITEYAAENIRNWRTDSGKLIAVKLREYMPVYSDDGFADDYEIQYRILRLIDGVYTQELQNEAGEPISSVITPRKANGSTWDMIPFVAAGSINNDICVDESPMYDIACINIGHYVASAEYEDGVHYHGQAQLHINIGEMSPQTWNELNPNGVQVGAVRGITTQGGSADLLQQQANTAAFESMQHKETQMVKMGGRLITEAGGNETAEAVRANTAAEHSTLETVVRNLGEALELCLYWVAEFDGATGEISVSMNTSFFDKAPDPQMIATLMGLESIQIIKPEVIISYLKKTGVVDDTLDDSEIMARIGGMGVE